MVLLNALQVYVVVRSAVAVVIIGFLVLFALLAGTCVFVSEIVEEATYHKKYGVEWKAQFEKDFGSLSKARFQAGVGFVGSVESWLF